MGKVETMGSRRLTLVGLACLGTSMAVAQLGGSKGSSSNEATGPATVAAAQQTLSTVNSQTASPSPQQAGQGDYRGSLIEGKSTGTVLDLSLDDAMARGLRTNLGLILQGTAEKTAAGQRLQSLQALLPTVTGTASYTVQQINLAAYGLNFPGFNPIVGPFQVFDFRASLSQSLVNVPSIERYVASKHSFQAAKLTAEDARNLVVLTVGNAYLLCIADLARIGAVQGELNSSKVSLDQATAAHEAGTSPKLDVLRAQVDYQNQQQQLISAQNNLSKDKLALARVIGLPLDQEFRTTDLVPYVALDYVDPNTAYAQALGARKDLKASSEQVKSANAQRTAAWAEQLPEAHFTGDFGDLGTTPAHSHSTYTATGEISAPILQIAKTRGDILVAEAAQEQAKARLSDRAQQVNADIRDAILDIEAAAKLVEATKSNVDLANEALLESQDRFRAGVSDNLAVSQAQAQTSQANDQYISALYQHNIAKLSLARALGIADSSYKTYLGGK
jgi:outer membrane protein TolC